MELKNSRDQILEKVRAGLGRGIDSAVTPLPTTARIGARLPGDERAEIDSLLTEISNLGGITRSIAKREDLVSALEELVEAEQVRKATLWETARLRELGLHEALASLGVEVVSSHAELRQLAECDLGITDVDAALPETGTLLLRSSPEQPRTVSLLPRVHLAILQPSDLRPDLHQALADAKGQGYFVFVTGPSRTADIELTLTIGVHGPKALYVWMQT